MCVYMCVSAMEKCIVDYTPPVGGSMGERTWDAPLRAERGKKPPTSSRVLQEAPRRGGGGPEVGWGTRVGRS